MEVQIQDLKQSLEQRNIKYVKVAVTDIDGVLRGKYMHIKKFKKSLDLVAYLDQNQKPSIAYL